MYVIDTVEELNFLYDFKVGKNISVSSVSHNNFIMSVNCLKQWLQTYTSTKMYVSGFFAFKLHSITSKNSFSFPRLIYIRYTRTFHTNEK